MVLDLNDSNWEKYFSKEELDEINNTVQDFQIQKSPEEFDEFIANVPKTTDIKIIFNYLNRCVIDPFENKGLYWFKKSLQDAAYHFITGYYPITDESERDIVRRVWSFIGESFDSSELKFRS